MNKLSIIQRKRLSTYVTNLRDVQYTNPAKHNCLAKPKPGAPKIDNSKQVVEMQLRGLKVPKEYKDVFNSANQFEMKEVSVQADSI